MDAPGRRAEDPAGQWPASARRLPRYWPSPRAPPALRTSRPRTTRPGRQARRCAASSMRSGDDASNAAAARHAYLRKLDSHLQELAADRLGQGGLDSHCREREQLTLSSDEQHVGKHREAALALLDEKAGRAVNVFLERVCWAARTQQCGEANRAALPVLLCAGPFPRRASESCRARNFAIRSIRRTGTGSDNGNLMVPLLRSYRRQLFGERLDHGIACRMSE